MIVIHKRGRFCYVEGNDCYVMYAIFHYKMKDNRCFFSKKKLEKILKILDSKHVYNNYDLYLKEGKQRYLFDSYITKITEQLKLHVGRRDFNQVLNKIKMMLYE